MTPRDTEHGKDADPGKGRVAFLHGQVDPPAPLPRGQHDLSPEYVADHQRRRIMDATTHVLAEHGYGPATIGHIVGRARVSRRTFYDHFESKDHCVLATFGTAVQCIADAVRDAHSREREWDAAMAAGLTELMRVLAEHPQTARTCFLELRSGTASADQALRTVRLSYTAALKRTVAARPGAEPAPDMAFEMGVGGLIAVIRGRLAAGDPEALQRELPEIAQALLGPLTGAEATAQVVARLGAQAGGPAAQAI